ncbi:TylF/MycF/NovP-related O-methyltransferase [Seonamhaeicola marinus]|uniref:TylF/MycF/NovP-related O-methyltransferase n=1 Tax=Seonamhaeicola marinus TaxID=1912246 RepID=UPI0016523CD5|nr:TylF/MycF/NovP-related O-methyltransferase [Seonamhaeicola marinus]
MKPINNVYRYVDFVEFISINNGKGKLNDYYNKKATYKNRMQLHEMLLSELHDKPINYIEFGVAAGEMIKKWSSTNSIKESRFLGFDSFEGLPERWEEKQQGHFNQQGEFPDIKDDRVSFVKGWFQDTVYGALQNFDFDNRSIYHLDADLFSSTLYVLFQIEPKLKKNDILIFDEFSSFNHEFKALEIFKSCINSKWNFEFIGAVNNYRQVAFVLK